MTDISILHFHTARDPETGANTYSWFLDSPDGETLKSSEFRWAEADRAIVDAQLKLSREFVNKELTILQEEWMYAVFALRPISSHTWSDLQAEEMSDKHIFNYIKSISLTNGLRDTLIPGDCEEFLFFSQKAPYTWRVRNREGSLLKRSERGFVTRERVIDDAYRALGKDVGTTIFVANYDWRNMLKERPYPVDPNPPQPKHTDATTTSELIVELVGGEGDDERICQAARVSTLGAQSAGTEESAGLINFLMKGRHGSPFEHNLMTFRIQAPIMVWREFMRHRVGFSYNEQSGRYMELEAKSYLPSRNRPLIQVGKPGAYTFEMGTDADFEYTINQLCTAYEAAWTAYHNLLDYGIAKEVARFPLPVAAYSTAYVTCNARSFMHFLSLRTKDENSTFPSYPQYEIEQVARAMESSFADIFPLTHAAFDANGRVAP